MSAPAESILAILEALPESVPYIPPWERKDSSEPWIQFEAVGSHVIAKVGGKFFEHITIEDDYR